MGFLKILLEVIARTVQACAAAIGSVISILFGRSSMPRQESAPPRGRKRKVVAVVCTVAIVASIARLLVTMVGTPQKVDLRPYEVLGKVCGEEITKLLGGHGEVVVIAWDTSHRKMPSVDTEVRSFKKALGETGGVSIRAMENLGGSRSPVLIEELTAGKLTAIIERYPGVDAIVSFVGIPQLKDEDLERWPRTAPKLVSVGIHDPTGRLKHLLEQKIVGLAILPRVGPIPDGAKKPVKDRDWFDRYYEIILPASAQNRGDK